MACKLFGDFRRPALCAAFKAEPALCGSDREQALAQLEVLEVQSSP
jgi:hypothetical protein